MGRSWIGSRIRRRDRLRSGPDALLESGELAQPHRHVVHRDLVSEELDVHQLIPDVGGFDGSVVVGALVDQVESAILGLGEDEVALALVVYSVVAGGDGRQSGIQDSVGCGVHVSIVQP
jgi:hypothetical protein